MSALYPTHRLAEFGDLSPAELDVINALGKEAKVYPRGAVISREGAPSESYYRLLDGWAGAAIGHANGSRQILKVHLPGDAMGTPSMSLTHTAETLFAITPVVASEIPYERFGDMLSQHPRLAAHFLLSVQRERVALMDRLASLGRTSAQSRLAAFILDLSERLDLIGKVHDGSFEMMLTQEQIGDAVGLTPIHVNRMLRELHDRKIVVGDRQHYTITTLTKLRELADQPMRTLNRNAKWLPQRSAGIDN